MDIITNVDSRKSYKEKCAEILLLKIFAYIIDFCTPGEILINRIYNERHFTLKQNRQSLEIAICPSGDIDITIYEQFSGRYDRSILFSMEHAQERINAFSNLLDWLLPLYFGKTALDMHILMDRLKWLDLFEFYKIYGEKLSIIS